MDRRLLRMRPLAERVSKLKIDDIAVAPGTAKTPPAELVLMADRIRAARAASRPVMVTYGAHLIKNGLAPMLIRLMEEGWITHLATNGAGSIHDWEFAYLGKSSEDVRENVAHGCFGTWEETGRYINLAVAVGGIDGLGYGASVGKMIADGYLDIPSADELRERIVKSASEGGSEQLGALSDMLSLVETLGLTPGRMVVEHPWREYSVQCAAYKLGVPLTVHPGIGYDIIYTHPANSGGAIGRGAVRDFLTYADSVARLQGGVHITVGSAIMAPMIFEKSMSMAKNLAIGRGEELSDYYLGVVDIADGGGWDWKLGEPPMENAAYYLRFCKSFYRMGGTLEYICMDNREFMQSLYDSLR